jgi:hypothetical protein
VLAGNRSSCGGGGRKRGGGGGGGGGGKRPGSQDREQIKDLQQARVILLVKGDESSLPHKGRGRGVGGGQEER